MNPQHHGTLFREVQKPEHRAAPQVVLAQLRRTPVSRQDDGTWVATGYDAVRSLIADPRISNDLRKSGPEATSKPSSTTTQEGVNPPFILQDAPNHERVRRIAMSHFGPPTQPHKVLSFEGEVVRLVKESLDLLASRSRMDVVDDFAYPLPVSVICSLLGIPTEDEPKFKRWTALISSQAAPDPNITAEQQQEIATASGEAFQYMLDLVNRRRADPGDDMISGMVHDTTGKGAIPDLDIANNAISLLIGGHETTVNTVTSAIMTFLRNPEQMRLLIARPDLMPGAFEEVLRLEPPLQFRDRTTLAEIDIEGVTIPKGVTVQLYLAAANRDPKRFTDPDAFDPQRPDNQHLSFLGGPHYCFGAPLARMEGRHMLTEWLRRVQAPRLVRDPPPYRSSPALRGPEHLLVDYDRIVD